MKGTPKAILLLIGLAAACGEPKGRETRVEASAPVSQPQGQAREGHVQQASSVAGPAASASVAAQGSPAPPVAPAAADALRAKLLAAFGGFEHVPDRAELLALAPESELVPALWALWQDPAARLAIRTNALVSLRFFPSPLVQERFEQLLRDPATTAVVRRPLAKAYGYAFGAAALPLLGELLDHADLHTRDSAARALAAIRDAKVRPMLEKHLSVEPEAAVRQTLQRLLVAPAGVP